MSESLQTMRLLFLALVLRLSVGQYPTGICLCQLDAHLRQVVKDLAAARIPPPTPSATPTQTMTTLLDGKTDGVANGTSGGGSEGGTNPSAESASTAMSDGSNESSQGGTDPASESASTAMPDGADGSSKVGTDPASESASTAMSDGSDESSQGETDLVSDSASTAMSDGSDESSQGGTDPVSEPASTVTSAGSDEVSQETTDPASESVATAMSDGSDGSSEGRTDPASESSITLMSDVASTVSGSMEGVTSNITSEGAIEETTFNTESSPSSEGKTTDEVSISNGSRVKRETSKPRESLGVVSPLGAVVYESASITLADANGVMYDSDFNASLCSCETKSIGEFAICLLNVPFNATVYGDMKSPQSRQHIEVLLPLLDCTFQQNLASYLRVLPLKFSEAESYLKPHFRVELSAYDFALTYEIRTAIETSAVTNEKIANYEVDVDDEKCFMVKDITPPRARPQSFMDKIKFIFLLLSIVIFALLAVLVCCGKRDKFYVRFW